MNQSLRTYLCLVCVGLTTAACNKIRPGKPKAKLNSLNETNATPLLRVDSPAAAFIEAQKRGYLANPDCGAGIKGGEEAMFATGAVEEMGQASGVIQQINGKFMFIQKASTATFLLFAPGVIKEGFLSQLNSPDPNPKTSKDHFVVIPSTWNITEYLRLACRVAFGRDGLETGKMYQKIEVGELDGSGGTAGLEIKPERLFVVKLTRLNKDLNGDSGRFKMYFSKVHGPVVVYVTAGEGDAPSLGNLGDINTINVYINYAGGSGVGSAETVDPHIKSCIAHGGTWSAYENGDKRKCTKIDKSISTDACRNIPDAVYVDFVTAEYRHCLIPVPY